MNAYRPGFAIPIASPSGSGGDGQVYYEPVYSVTGVAVVSSLTGDIMMGRVTYAT